jgi:hypothetical protein
MLDAENNRPKASGSIWEGGREGGREAGAVLAAVTEIPAFKPVLCCFTISSYSNSAFRIGN